MSSRHSEYLISTADLQAALADPDLVILDATTTLVPNAARTFDIVTGQADFEAAHIPGAQFVDLERDLSRPAPGLLFTLAEVADFAAAATRLGIGAASRVVVYSSAQPGWAVRLWLTLRAYGFSQVKVLDGGLMAWRAEDRPVDTGPARPRPLPVQPFAWRDDRAAFFTDTARVEQAVTSGDAILVNALGRDYFAGTAAITYGRKGNIPGSRNLPTSALVGADGRFLSADDLAQLYAAEGIAADQATITYCGAGVAASNVAFGRLLLGLDDTRVYDGSLMEWAQDPARPLVP
ncbi:sulfurtransferase [Ketogulonicigenium vulgare]|uniref:3-mercaptopyruvate sulfurtransferase (Rhodanese-like protein protein) n=1 Tax=Ketogulonicigenium vulgare (strain WSH-001) TaxID=759362 RepID=F9Y3Y6_KETVW|nr:rhodanese-like domain-containing protein [Ketogulonicigenium vulgare]ADO43392.1 Rhodanese domain protein [Ketogulonicigenium vulgare Y25]AEM41677.1 3-mercaptopyruvate sulfurtransferase (Rhodanese-like protein protein) [Ketogulonicigenium vulgare WSH-001]ALJ81785.1 3-mercaptopyruvate sulfurtransferase [Ketogulonicigenium vulgare]ANW34442.1 3-mercaptopyruvate sulfurtransferase [Ketogulonicigenium vulgare]AOZ55427.1 Rhodanese domain protein [Ketogulonicigenium vulgare]